MADQQESGAENIQGWLILAAVGAALLFLIWYFAEHEIKNVVRWIRYAEIWMFEKLLWLWEFTYEKIMGVPPDPFQFNWGNQAINFRDTYPFIPQVPKENLDNDTIIMISAMAMDPLKIPFIIFFFAAATWCVFKGPRTHFRRKMGLDGLIRNQAEVFPVISPFVEFDPSDMPVRPPGAPVPAELPMFSEALGPEEWLAFNDIPIPDGQIDKNEAVAAFTKQLGRKWRGPAKLSPDRQILLASFCLKAARKRNQADELLGKLAMCWSHKKGLKLNACPGILKEARKILANKKLSGSTLSVCNQHAWEVTALMRALQFARSEGGVLAPAQFVWLRAHDRDLWYPLNNVGRQALHMEAIGAHAHYKVEKITQRPIPAPRVDDAYEAIKEYMETDRARPIPALDYSQSKKRSIKKLA